MTSRTKTWLMIIIILACLIIVKVVWVSIAMRGVGDFKTERADLLRRRDYLIGKIITAPEQLLKEMPPGVGAQFQGEWALYSCSMLSAALVNLSYLYPDTREESVGHIDKLIQIVMTPEIQRYDEMRWGEGPLESLGGDNSHISYLSHLAWMIAGYKLIGGDGKYDQLFHTLCSTMNRRLLASPAMNLETYPGEYVYIPDMLVAIVALKLYSQLYNGKYASTVEMWLEHTRQNHISRSCGLIASMVMYDCMEPNCVRVKGSYTALSIYYLTFVDKCFARYQYDIFKDQFLKKWPVAGFKEYSVRARLFALDVDAGPILFGLSPSGTAFGIGPVTCFGDTKLRKRFLRTAEIAGTTVSAQGKSHYLLSNAALVGEAIVLAMRTATPWF